MALLLFSTVTCLTIWHCCSLAQSLTLQYSTGALQHSHLLYNMALLLFSTVLNNYAQLLLVLLPTMSLACLCNTITRWPCLPNSLVATLSPQSVPFTMVCLPLMQLWPFDMSLHTNQCFEWNTFQAQGSFIYPFTSSTRELHSPPSSSMRELLHK